MSQPRDDRQDDLFRPPPEEIINLRHPLVRLAGEMVAAIAIQNIASSSIAAKAGKACRVVMALFCRANNVGIGGRPS